MLNIWARSRKALDSFVKILKRVKGEKKATNPKKYKGKRYNPFTFLETVLNEYHNRKKQSN